MSLEFTKRTLVFYRRHGLSASLSRALESIRGIVSNRRAVLFRCDLQHSFSIPGQLPDGISVERKDCMADMAEGDLEKVLNYWNRDLQTKQLCERFQRGAAFWLIKKNNQLAGYGWTLTGSTMKPHFFPLGANDVHLFDFVVFPEFRGQGINPVLVNRVLEMITAEGRVSAFIEAAIQNKSQLRSLQKTAFRRHAAATKVELLGHSLVLWHELSSLPK
jgi:ribosomal protein S18 acetylase RimI-like enzyme